MKYCGTIVSKAKPRKVRASSTKKKQRVSKPKTTSTTKYMARSNKVATGGSKVRNYKK